MCPHDAGRAAGHPDQLPAPVVVDADRDPPLPAGVEDLAVAALQVHAPDPAVLERPDEQGPAARGDALGLPAARNLNLPWQVARRRTRRCRGGGGRGRGGAGDEGQRGQDGDNGSCTGHGRPLGGRTVNVCPDCARSTGASIGSRSTPPVDRRGTGSRWGTGLRPGRPSTWSGSS